MISRTVIGNKSLTLFTRFLASTVQKSEAPKEKSYRMPEKKPSTQQTDVQSEEKPYRMPEEETFPSFGSSPTAQLSSPPVPEQAKIDNPSITTTPLCNSIFFLNVSDQVQPVYNWDQLGYMTFPASLPLMIGADILVFFAWILNKKHYKYIIERVYLYNSNKIEFTFSNKIRRKLKNTEDCHMFIGPEDLKTPLHNQDGSLAWNQKGAKFPQKLDYAKNPKTNEIEFAKPELKGQYGWTKYTNNYTPYIFPKSYEYCNWEILVPLLSGRYIDIEFGTNQLHEDLDTIKDNASVQQELAWIEQDRKKNEEYLQAKKEGKQVTLS